MHAQRILATLAVVLVTVTAGCGFITGQSALAFGASPATVSDDALSETGYDEVAVDNSTVTRNVSAAGQTRQVEVTNQQARYERAVDLGPLGSQRAAVFVTFASPEVSAVGQTFNPISDMSTEEVLGQFESQYDGLSVGDRVENRSVEALGSQRTLEQYEGTATLSGVEVDVYVHAAKFRHEGDYIVAVGIHPQRLDGETENVVALTEGLDHDGDD
ncbi:hypothetical protein C475_10819 [Halosimplex carlsbadense 2-9-1]|uniref:Lipoprotein n=1 Tax=Halosimplex carlsbadense 2-9-1 TaxID=797114 RepID=M0CQZ2_9EURY|nr:DUF6517 family protein [Halosimplex carlsbadense]ELZ25033.1 hypothetical protein C475_10819 [Halosimplex carlsbadense 2-9-1]